MKYLQRLGLITLFALIAVYGLYLVSESMMDVPQTFAQPTFHDHGHGGDEEEDDHDPDHAADGDEGDTDHDDDHDAEDDADHDSDDESTTLSGLVYHVTQPGLPRRSERILEENTVPPGPWVLSGRWTLEVDQATGTVSNFKAKLSMVRIAEPGAPLLDGGTSRDWHAMKIRMKSGTIVLDHEGDDDADHDEDGDDDHEADNDVNHDSNHEVAFDDGESLHVTGMATVKSSAGTRFSQEPVEIIVAGGEAPTIAIWFDTEPEAITNASFIEGSEAPRNARVHVGGVILGTVD